MSLKDSLGRIKGRIIYRLRRLRHGKLVNELDQLNESLERAIDYINSAILWKIGAEYKDFNRDYIVGSLPHAHISAQFTVYVSTDMEVYVNLRPMCTSPIREMLLNSEVFREYVMTKVMSKYNITITFDEPILTLSNDVFFKVSMDQLLNSAVISPLKEIIEDIDSLLQSIEEDVIEDIITKPENLNAHIMNKMFDS